MLVGAASAISNSSASSVGMAHSIKKEGIKHGTASGISAPAYVSCTCFLRAKWKNFLLFEVLELCLKTTLYPSFS